MLYHDDKILKWIWLLQLKGVGPCSANKLYRWLPDINKIYECSDLQILQKCKGVSQNQANEIALNKNLNKAEEIYHNCEKNKIRIMTPDDENFPRRLIERPDISPVIYWKGNNKLNRISTCGIVGSRRCSEEGKRKAIELAKQQSDAGMGIVSGLAKGIDSYAHTAVIKSGGYPVAVLGNGLDICYPSEHSVLMNAIENNGMLISTFPPGTYPRKYAFPARNRVIAALSDILYIPEKTRNSGANTTVEAMLKYKKPVCYMQ